MDKLNARTVTIQTKDVTMHDYLNFIQAVTLVFDVAYVYMNIKIPILYLLMNIVIY